MKKELVNNILNKIKDRHIKPKPRWVYLVRDCFIWSLGVLSFIAASLIFAVVLYFLIQNDWSLYRRFSQSFVGFIFITLPYYWIVFMAVAIGATYYNIRHTKKGYRFGLPRLTLVSVAAVMVIGSLFYGAGIGEAIDDKLSASVPMYTKYINKRVFYFTNPENGLLAGRITNVRTPEQFEIVDIGRNIWQIEVVSEPKFVPLIQIREGNKVKIIGKIVDEKKFQAERVMPLGPGREMFRRIKLMHEPLEQKIFQNFPDKR